MSRQPDRSRHTQIDRDRDTGGNTDGYREVGQVSGSVNASGSRERERGRSRTEAYFRWVCGCVGQAELSS